MFYNKILNGETVVYDCFTFFNELDLLEIRLNELDSVVDKFVIVECTETHSKAKKQLFFDKNKDRFSKFSDKIIHIIVDDAPDIVQNSSQEPDRWIVEKFQRNCIERGLTSCADNDIILVSDIDEIPSSLAVRKSIELLDKNNVCTVSFKQRFFYYFLNGLCFSGNTEYPWLGTVACYFKNFTGGDNTRMTKAQNVNVINDAGWHFSYLGGIEKIVNKIESFAHSEFDNSNIKNKDRIKDRIDKGIDIFDRARGPRQVYIEIDKSFPEYLRNNIKKFKHLIKETS
tara:strand:- start:658 stop:1512 length:855 start_codon:yes stop_codon:yes gene_type:complete